MSSSPSSDTSSSPFVSSSLYQEFLAEREEILRHKWLLSEAAARDVGFEYALIHWVRNHRRDWRAARRRCTA
ncbi:MAG TPA: DUF4032 domain-containing protein [Acidobacteriota bacterium]|nr:DUF4032 domain-containing protein [Acidobacteriota bacterium]